MEHIALHQASQLNGAQFYISCAQVTMSANEAGTIGPLVVFPGAYKATDPGIHYDINPPVKNDPDKQKIEQISETFDKTHICHICLIIDS
jgi:hypothetical protein